MSHMLQDRRIPRPQRPENQFTKLLLFAIVEGEEWEEDEDTSAWKVKMVPVLRKPQGEWAKATNHHPRWIFFIPETTDSETTDPNDIEWPDWIPAYWDSQAGRWVAIRAGGGGGGALFKTPSGGIPAMTISGSTYNFGQASCTRYKTDGTSEGSTADVYNSVSAAIAGDKIIQAKRIGGLWFCDVVDCSTDDPESAPFVDPEELSEEDSAIAIEIVV